MADGTLIIAVPPSDMTSEEYNPAPVTTVTNEAGLFTAELSDFAEIDTLDPLLCCIPAVTYGVVRGTVHGAAGVALTPPPGPARRIKRQAYYRTCVHDGTLGSGAMTTSVLPNGVTGGTAAGGASTTTLDDNPYVGGSTAYYTVTAGNTFLVDFATGTPTTGLREVFAVQVQNQSLHGFESEFTLNLYDNGVFVSTLRTVVLPPGIGMVTLIAAWNGSTAAGATTQLRIDVASASAGSLRVHRVRWYELSAVTGTDTDLVPLIYPDAIETAGGSLHTPPLAHLTYTGTVAGADIVLHSWIADALTDMSTAYADPIRIGRLWSSGHIQPANGPGPGSSVTVEDASTNGETIGGQTTGNVGARRRVANLSLPMLTGAEAATLAWRLDYGSGRLNPFMVSILPDDDDFRAWGCLYCTMEPDGITFPSAVIRSRSMQLREKL